MARAHSSARAPLGWLNYSGGNRRLLMSTFNRRDSSEPAQAQQRCATDPDSRPMSSQRACDLSRRALR